LGLACVDHGDSAKRQASINRVAAKRLRIFPLRTVIKSPNCNKKRRHGSRSRSRRNTREWLDALDSVEAFDGIGRVDELLDGIVQAARRNS
jgi:hypothetical protein